jgi:S1-C subfamily serine protease
MTTLSAFSDELAEAIAQAAPMIVTLPARRFTISGVYWRSGIVVTTVDAVRCRGEMALLTPDGEALSASIVGTDPGTDIAVLRVDAPDLPTAQMGDLDTLRVGHFVLALGRLDDGNIQASSGILASLGGEWQSWTGGRIDRLIRPDIQPFPGFSGSPLLDTQGRVLGINTTHSRGRFAITIPITTVNRVVDQLLERGRVTRGYLGVGLQPVELTAQLKQSLNLSQEVGVLIVSVEADSPADRAGILIGDILLTLGGEAIANMQALRSQLRSEQIGQPMTAQLIRGGQLIELTLTVGER